VPDRSCGLVGRMVTVLRPSAAALVIASSTLSTASSSAAAFSHVSAASRTLRYQYLFVDILPWYQKSRL
jgi:hypothetical protein